MATNSMLPLLFSLAIVSSLLGGETKELPNDSQMVASVRITQKFLNFATTSIKKALENEMLRFSLPPEKIRYYAMDVIATNIRISNFTPPVVVITLREPSTVQVAVTEGDFHVCTDWRVKKAFIPMGSGHVCATPEDKLRMEVSVSGKPSKAKDGTMELRVSHCKLQSKMNIDMAGVMGKLVDVARKYMQGTVQGQLEGVLCRVVETKVKALFDLNSEIKLNDYYRIKNKLLSLTVVKDELDVELVSKFIPVL